MTFVQALLDHTKEYESPTSFWKWAAYSCIAGVLRDNIWLADGDSRIYPNIYTLFLAGSGQRKGRPIGLADSLVHEVNNVTVISGRASIQAILYEIGHTETDKNGKIKRGGSAIFFAPELSAGIVTDDQAIQILTDIYDYKATGHTTNLVGRGKSKLEKLVFSMLAASNEELLKELYSSKAIYGGLLGRTFLICPDERRPARPFPSSNDEEYHKLVVKLTKISQLSGTYVFNEPARKFYEKWYLEYWENLKKKSDKTGIYSRLPTGVKKISLILAADELLTEVGVCHVEKAIDECIALLPNYTLLSMSGGTSSIADAGSIILQELYASEGHSQSKKELLRKHWAKFDAELLDKTMVTLEAAGMIQQILTKQDLYYKLTDKCLETIFKTR